VWHAHSCMSLARLLSPCELAGFAILQGWGRASCAHRQAIIMNMGISILPAIGRARATPCTASGSRPGRTCTRIWACAARHAPSLPAAASAASLPPPQAFPPPQHAAAADAGVACCCHS
jgi:hypothetical protein